MFSDKKGERSSRAMQLLVSLEGSAFSGITPGAVFVYNVHCFASDAEVNKRASAEEKAR